MSEGGFNVGRGIWATVTGLHVVAPLGAAGGRLWRRETDIITSINNILKNLCRLSPGDLPLRPFVGAGLEDLIDDPMTQDRVALIKVRLQAQIASFEKRVELVRINAALNQNASGEAEDGVVFITITVRIKSSREVLTLGAKISILDAT